MRIPSYFPSTAIHKSSLLLLLAALPTLLSGCLNPGFGFGKVVVGSGEIVTDTLTLESFDKVALTGSGTVFIEQGESQSVVVRADDNVLPLLISEVSGGQLELGQKSNTSIMRATVEYQITVPDLKAIILSGSGEFKVKPVKSNVVEVLLTGSGDISFDQIDAQDLQFELSGSGTIGISGVSVEHIEATIHGSGDINAEGTSNTLDIEVSGSGDFNGINLQSGSVTVKIPGSGTISINAISSLDVTISGSGNVRYAGNPTVTADISGSGDVKRR